MESGTAIAVWSKQVILVSEHIFWLSKLESSSISIAFSDIVFQGTKHNN